MFTIHDWEWLIAPIEMVMTGGLCKWHCFNHMKIFILSLIPDEKLRR